MRGSIIAISAILLAACGSEAGNEQAAANKAAPASSGGGGMAAGAMTMQPGQWEIRTEVGRMEVPNMPAGMSPPTPPPTTVNTCLTPEQARAPSGDFLTGSGQAAGCTTENMSMAGGRVRGIVQCNQQGTTMRSTMDGQFSPTSFEINQRVETSAQGMNMTMESRTTGRRTGDCPG
jgi:hypothetical protein